MSSILIILDQPKYGTSTGFIASPSINVRSVFAGDLVEENLSAMRDIRGRRYDTVLIPETITKDSSDYEKLQKAIRDITVWCPEVKIHQYANQY